MPELPEVEVIKDQLIGCIQGKTISGFNVAKPYILKNYFADTLSGEVVQDIQRKGKYLIIDLSKHTIIIHLMLRGRINHVRNKKVPRSAAAWVSFSDGSLLYISEQGHKKRVAVYITSRGKMIPHVVSLGIDPLSTRFTQTVLKELLVKWKCQVRTFLRKQSVIAGIGNAYADEILWKAKLSPFQMTDRLSEKQIARLHDAIKRILLWASEEVRKNGIDEKRSFLRIHGKKGRECPRCKMQIMTISLSDSDTFYCPGCQTRGKVLKDRRISKFYR